MGEKYKLVTIKGREYRIGKFGARDGAYIVMKVAGLLAPLAGAFVQGGKIQQIANTSSPSDVLVGDVDVAKLLAPLAAVSEADFTYLQEKSLRVCHVKMPAGWVPVLTDTGDFSQPELEDDAAAVMALMVHALIHNLTGFFDGSPLTGWLSGLLTTSPPAS